MPKSKSAKELTFLILPCAALLGVYLYLFRRESQQRVDTSGPWRLEIDKVTVEPPSPLEASEGFDTRVRVKAHEAGARPISAGYNQYSDKYAQGDVQLRSDGTSSGWPLVRTNRYTGDFEWPLNTGPLVEWPSIGNRSQVKDLVYLIDRDKTNSKTALQLSGKCYLTAEIRDRSARVLPPGVTRRKIGYEDRLVSRGAPLEVTVPADLPAPKEAEPRIIGQEVETLSPQDSKQYAGLEKRLWLHITGIPDRPEDEFPTIWGELRLVDGANKVIVSKKTAPIFFQDQGIVTSDPRNLPGYFYRNFSLNSIYASRGPLYCEGWISVRGSVPLRFRVKARE